MVRADPAQSALAAQMLRVRIGSHQPQPQQDQEQPLQPTQPQIPGEGQQQGEQQQPPLLQHQHQQVPQLSLHERDHHRNHALDEHDEYVAERLHRPVEDTEDASGILEPEELLVGAPHSVIATTETPRRTRSREPQPIIRDDSLPRGGAGHGRQRRMGRRAGQRYHNQMFLRSLHQRLTRSGVPGSDVDEFEQEQSMPASVHLRTPLDQSSSIFHELFEDEENLKLWHEFNALSPRQQTKVLTKLSPQKQPQAAPGDSNFFQIAKQTRTTLKRRRAVALPFLAHFEANLIDAARNVAKCVETHQVVGADVQLSQGCTLSPCLQQPGCGLLAVDLDDSFTRLLMHALCDFHGLSHHTHVVPKISSKQVHVTIPSSYFDRAPQVTLCQYLDPSAFMTSQECGDAEGLTLH
eukprot:m.181765 g.181765  ORF g.181765 m.181765 type:complete len:408 (+) comp14663_c1_seq4:135-1358(+)